MTITIGRFSCAQGVSTWEHSDGQKVSMSGDWVPSSVAEGQAWRQQVLGLLTPPKVVPVTDTDDTTRDGYYRVLSGSVTPWQSFLLTGAVGWQLELERLRQSTTSLHEEELTGAARTTALTGYTATPWHCYHDGYRGYHLASGTALTTTGGRSGIDHDGSGGALGFASASAMYDDVAQWRIEIADHYSMSAQLEYGGYAVTGQMEGAWADWRLSGGLWRLGPGTTSTFLRTHLSSGWGTPFGVNFGYYDGGWVALYPGDANQTEIDGVFCLRESAEWCTLQIPITFYDGSKQCAVTLDVSCRRGDWVTHISVQGSTSKKWGLALSSASASTAVGGAGQEVGVQKNAANDNGYALLLASTTNTRDTGNGRCYITTAATTAHLGIGTEKTSSSSPNTTTDILNQFLAAQATRESIAGTQL
jgi:hypothetical protein